MECQSREGSKVLKSWSLENFKPIASLHELKLAPVTVLAGLNSSGKSSLLQSILMVAQTLRGPLKDRPLLPTEATVQLGTFESILHAASGSRTLSLGFELEMTDDETRRSLGRRPADAGLQ